ncbi:MAG: hypothetical protein IAF38_01815 [Bacteroidia bacterium]|nr:hypothetical protein [Bacteroidia bacterium]
MKQRSFKLTIPEPCTQSWDEMEQRKGGRYCLSCSKVVTDFSGMSNYEIASFLMQQSTGVCARIPVSKMNDTFYYAGKKPMKFNYTLLRLSLAGLLTLSSVKGFSQGAPFMIPSTHIDNSGLIKGKKVITTKTPITTTVFTIKIKDAVTAKAINASGVEISAYGFIFEGKGSELLVSIPDSLMGEKITISVSANKYEFTSKTIELTRSMNKTIFVALKEEQEYFMGLIAPVKKP